MCSPSFGDDKNGCYRGGDGRDKALPCLYMPTQHYINKYINKFKTLLIMRNVIFWMLALVMMSVASVNAQVIIGGNEADEPHAGAILDLSPLGIKSLGLLLPNVELGTSATDFALVASATDGQKTAARGLIVYNAKDVLNGAGLYVWTGEKWKVIALAGN
jgi:hypothetical protein